MAQLKRHSYEEIRGVVVDVLLGKAGVSPPTQYVELKSSVAAVLGAREGLQPESIGGHQLHRDDAELLRDVFWDLFRQGTIILGVDDANGAWPWFRLSHFGTRTLQSQRPYRFHDTASFIALVKKEVPDVLAETLVYLEEAVAAFYAECLLASCVMLGVAAENEFLRVVDVAATSSVHGARFASVQKPPFIRTKITKFQAAIQPLIPELPKDAVEDLDTNLSGIQSVLRIARNEAGHPTAKAIEREQVYVFLQLFCSLRAPAHETANGIELDRRGLRACLICNGPSDMPRLLSFSTSRCCASLARI